MKSYQEIAALNTKVERTAERYRTLLEINNAIITNLNQEALLHAISEALRRVIPFDRAAFTLYDPEKREISLPRHRRHCCLIALSSRAGVRPGGSITSWVFDHQLPAVRHDLEKEQQYPK